MQKILQVENVTKSYGSREIIKNISLSINKGEIVGFLGPNGAGKTTTMRMISGFTSPTKGKIKILGLDPELEKNKTSSSSAFRRYGCKHISNNQSTSKESQS